MRASRTNFCVQMKYLALLQLEYDYEGEDVKAAPNGTGASVWRPSTGETTQLS